LASSIEKAKTWISDLTELPEVGREYSATIKAIKDFGAFVEFIPGTEGLVHISEWDWTHVSDLNALAKEGDKVVVKLLEVDQRTGKFRLSRKAMIPQPEYKATDGAPAPTAGAPQGDRGPRRDDRGPRRDDRRGGDRR